MPGEVVLRVIKCRVLTPLPQFNLSADDIFFLDHEDRLVEPGDLILADIGGEIRIARVGEAGIETTSGWEQIYEILGKITVL